MVPAHPLRLGAALAGCVLLAACGSDDGGDLASFCEAVEELRSEDPFAELSLASPAEMRDAFDALAEAAGRIERQAPEETRVHAGRYREAIDALRDELAGAAYDPTRVDNLRYADAVSDYTDAAVSLDNAADAAC